MSALLQFTVPHQRDRCINKIKAVIESLSLCSTLRQDADGPFPVVAATQFLGHQLTDFGSAPPERSYVSGNPVTLRKDGFFHARNPKLH